MNGSDDLELVRRLREHYRHTASDAVPAALHAEVREMLTSPVRRRRLRGGPLAAVAATFLVAVLGTVLAFGQRGATPSAGASAPSSAAVGAPSTAAVGSRPSSSPAPSASQPIVGEVPVLRGSAIFGAVAASHDASPFLIGGRISYVLADCAVPPDFPETPLLRACGDGLVVVGADLSFGIPLVTDMVESGLHFSEPAAVLRVHTHDERAADCPPAYRTRCERALVVEQLVWRPTGSAIIPTVLSILPSQVDADQCAALAFEPVRCVAVVERARSIGSIPWPDVIAVRLERTNPRADSLGSEGIATVVFGRLDGIETRIDVRCMGLRGPSLVCGPSTVRPILPDSPAP